MFIVLEKVLSIVLLTMMGIFLRKYRVVDKNFIAIIKKLIINLFLPIILFRVFINMELKVDYIFLIFSMCLLFFSFYLIGVGLDKVKGRNSIMRPFFYTGFSFGSLGIPLFILFFGEDNLDIFSIMGLSQEIFVWFIYYPLLMLKYEGKSFNIRQVSGILKSPMIIAILLGVFLNLIGLRTLLNNNVITSYILGLMRHASTINTPLILISIGYGLRLRKDIMRESLELSITRMLIVLGGGFAFRLFILQGLFNMSGALIDISLFALLILPPALSLPIFIGNYGEKEEEELANNAVIFNTLASIVIFITYGVAMTSF